MELRLPLNFTTWADVHDKATRSYNMSRIRAKNTKPEMLVRKYVHYEVEIQFSKNPLNVLG